ncbi:DegT/DnrJ/EryC1/StrS family aminotransferase [Prosthecodimorpha staleyi]|uniref:DegT/DnrJ/EryC1/StrS family aminotransferase n=1 Tax=Prosthecodimorpha staleyi TaxID=2840188 RepID=A0A947D8G1_9HYPH|nr:DegT/DnrJ/EryC1/StrS family aminotransferase [Prosthecodimorpha staleyi]MBT9292014.1 DegT/DnrJ/EryC1/StrS family aminotransferase [Prosthecodimorpha staleyi]
MNTRCRTALDYAGMIRRGEPFHFVKINHGFWERYALARDHRALRGLDRFDALSASEKADDAAFLAEFKAQLQALPAADPPIDFGVSLDNWPGSGREAPTPHFPAEILAPIVAEFVPARALTADAQVWRRAVFDGTLAAFVDALRSRKVVVVGPPWLAHFGAFARLPDCRFEPIPATAALSERHAILERIAAAHRAEEAPVYLIQAGYVSAWLGPRIAQTLAGSTVVDLGASLDLCHIPKATRWRWAQHRRMEVADTILSINPDWPADPRAAPGLAPEAAAELWEEFTTGRLAGLWRRVGIGRPDTRSSLLDRPDLGARHVRFVEAKRPDWGRIAAFAALSETAGMWANAGPVVAALERELARLLKIGRGRTVVAAASGTAATYALAGLSAVALGRNPRWVASAYGFLSSGIGPLSDTIFVDCDASGMIDLAAVAALPEADWDGLIATNAFGLQETMAPVIAFCRARGKRLIVDSAQGFLGIERDAPEHQADEIVSLHATKPIGTGEGGFAIVSEEDAPRLRALLNFGVGLDPVARSYAANGKMSEIAAAAALERLERLPSWRPLYVSQRERMELIVGHLGLRPLGRPPARSVLASLPVLMPAAYRSEDLPPARFDCGRYYRPLSPDAPVAASIYRRMLNLPCHPGMAAISNEEIRSLLTVVAGEVGAGTPEDIQALRRRKRRTPRKPWWLAWRRRS